MTPNEVVADGVEPKGLDVFDVEKGEEPNVEAVDEKPGLVNAGCFPNGLEDGVDEKGFAGV